MSPRLNLQVSAGFVLLTAWFALASGFHALATVLCAAAVHELGHWLLLRAFGAQISGLRIGILGAVLETDSTRLSYGKELAAVLAGPGANLLCALGLAALGEGRWLTLAGANAALCAFNLLPIVPLDGGRALHLAASWLAGPGAGDAAARWTGAAFALALAALLAFVMARSGGSLWLLPAAAASAGTALRNIANKV